MDKNFFKAFAFPIVMGLFIFVMIIFHIGYSSGKTDGEKQAISRGYATYDKAGNFQWK